jgi:enamine deaminase RidA (YjgF/YER057c/UK114 family)
MYLFSFNKTFTIVSMDHSSQLKKHQCIRNLKAVLEAAGSSLDKAVKVNVFITDMKNFTAMNEVYVQYWGAVKPVRT